MNKRIILSVLTLVFILTLTVEAATLNVSNDFDTALKIAKLEKLQAIIMFSDPSCFYCNKFKKETLKDEEVVKLLNANFVFSEINPETDKTSNFFGQELTYIDLYGAFRISGTPTFWFFTEETTPVTYLPGYVDAKNFSKILKFMAQKLYEKDVKFSDYVNQNDDFMGTPKITKVKTEDFEWLLQNDPSIVLVENQDIENFDPFAKYAVVSQELAEKLLEMGAYNVILKAEEVASN